MTGNSKHPGADSRSKDNTAGSGGRIRRSFRDKDPAPKAEDCVYHRTHRARQEVLERQANHPKARTDNAPMGTDQVVGHNPVLEALAAGLPLKQAYTTEDAEREDRLRDTLKFAARHSLPLLQVTRTELDRVTGSLVHQRVTLQLPTFNYTGIEDIFDTVFEVPSWGLIAALDQATNPRSLGTIIRSVAVLGTREAVIPARRSASITAAAWKTSAEATARIPVVRVANLNQILHHTSGVGFTIIGLAGEGDTPLSDVPRLDGPVVVVVGSEGEDLTHLVRRNYGALASIPITSTTESLNASVATSIALYEIGQQRVSQVKISPSLGLWLLTGS